MIVAAYNPETDNLEKTYLSSYQQKGVTLFPVKNNSGFIVNRPVLIGRMGGERSELNTCTAVDTSKLSITVAPTLFEHTPDDPIYLMTWDVIRFYRSDSINGTYTLLIEMPIDVDNAEKVTRYDDTDAEPQHYYKSAFYNTITKEISELSDPTRASGFDEETAGDVIDIVVRRVRDTAFTVLGISEYLDIMDEVDDDLITQAHKPYRWLKKNPPATLDAVAGQNYINMPSDMWKFDYIEVLTASGGYRRYDEITPMSKEQFEGRYNNNQTSPQSNILEFALDEETNKFLIYPTPSVNVTGAVIVHYYKKFNRITDVGDVIETPTNLVYRYKMMAEYYSAKSEVDRQWAALAAKYEGKYGNEVVKMQRTNRLDTGTPRAFMPNRYYRRRRYKL